jgi:DNA-binding transcriptional LysR family regulator
VLEIAPSAGITIDVSDAVVAALVASAGIGISATYIAAPFVGRGELVPVMYEFAHDLFPLTALWPESRRGNPNVKAFVAFLAEIFSSPPPWDHYIAHVARSQNSAS